MSPIRAPVTLVGHRMDGDAHRLRDFLTRIAQPYEWHEAGTPEADRSSRATARARRTCLAELRDGR